MNDHVLGRQSLPGALLAILRALAPAIIAVAGLYVITTRVAGERFSDPYIALAVIVGILGVVILPRGEATPFGRPLAFGSLQIATATLVRWVALLGVLLFLGFATKTSAIYSRQIILTWAVAMPCVLVLLAIGMHELTLYLDLRGAGNRRVVFAGCNEVSTALAARLRQARSMRLDVAGFFDDRSGERLGLGVADRLLGRLPDLATYVKANGVDVIFVALPMRHLPRVVDLLDDLRDTTASIYYVPDIFVYDLIQARTAEIAGMPVVAMCETPFYGYRGVLKRLTDIVLAGTALLLLLPLMVLIGILVKTTSRGPMIFRQRRYGLDGEEINVWKFRSMTVVEDGDRIIQAQRNDSRVTPLGAILRRTSLDELPQLVNVLQGSMSLVGPRPHAVAHNEQYRRLIKGYMIRHKVRPGITGLAQVNGCRGETQQLEEMQARVQYDLDYLRAWSLALDLLILWRTFLLLFRREDRAY